MKLTIVNDLGPTGVQAHKAGCRDLTKHSSLDSYTEEYASKREAFLDYNEDFIEEDDENNAWTIDFAPCCKGLPAV